MTPLNRYTLLMTAARDHARQGEWGVAQDYCSEATRVCTRSSEPGSLARKAWSMKCWDVCYSQTYRRKMGGRYAREAT